ncbi:ATP-dependent DNA helicase Q-like 5 [Solanum dulcamara]|uniref:ATP-dependent DNA helicase Q-like 5 n=1 Tax=Solanum dulcamara TaxID=45834 RepID=UPI00248522A5|nr:ATP-dependent DNA helicase Q-like 5 [Solanum dulcamara]
MDSDSDSDGSHISSTPPRHPPPSPQFSSRRALLATAKSRAQAKNTSAISTKISRPLLRPKTSTKKPIKSKDDTTIQSQQNLSDLPFHIHSNDTVCSEALPSRGSFYSKFASSSRTQETPIQNPPSPPTFSDLPFQIHRSENAAVLSHDNSSGEVLPAGGLYLPKFASFSKTHKTILNFEPVEADSIDPRLVQENEKEAVESGCRTKAARKHPNLIGSNVSSTSSLPVKKVKCANEGNFVRLNINGYGKKFASKFKRKNFNSSSGKKFYRRWKKKVGVEGKKGENGLCDEEGLVVEVKGRGERLDFDAELIEEAVMRVRNEVSDENLLRLLKLTYGYDSFRDGQLETLKMVLSGKSTMLVLPTGAGKSLCYQLPAMVLQGVTIVISPLVSLMIDQLKQLPAAVEGGLLCSSQTPEEVWETFRLLEEGSIKVLFVSPERFLNSEFLSIFCNTQISLVVIDEAHCVSEWSHNFRPSYMRLKASLLRDKLKAQCILAMTATATTKALYHVMHALDIPSTNLIQVLKPRDNLQLSVSSSENRMKDLMTLLKSSPFSEAKSIIIYCKFQSETDFICKYLCDSNISAKSYHSGIFAKDRSRTQELFCANKIRVVVATVAFGMGLNKKDIEAVIHYSLPESLEEYVQEIGRAGRDGRISYCHLFFDDVSYFKIRSLMYSDGVDEYVVNKLLCQIFSGSTNSVGIICSLVKESACRKFDMKEEVILTILTQLELGEVQYLHLLPQTSVTCTLNFHQTSPALLAMKDAVVAAILKNSEIKDGQHIFDIPSVANSIGLQVVDLSNHLQTLKIKGEVAYELKDQAYCYVIMDTPKDICSLATQLTKWLSEVESCKVRKMDTMYDAAVFAVEACDKVHGCRGHQHTPCLQRKITEYFVNGTEVVIPKRIGGSSPFLAADIKVFLQCNSHAKFTPRAIARILHGIASPAFPSAVWSRTHFWGRYMQTDFKAITEAAKTELMKLVGKDALKGGHSML